MTHTHTAALDRIVYVQKFRADLASSEHLYNAGSKILPEKSSSFTINRRSNRPFMGQIVYQLKVWWASPKDAMF